MNWRGKVLGFWFAGSLFWIGFIALAAGTDGTVSWKEAALAIVPPVIAGGVAKIALGIRKTAD